MFARVYGGRVRQLLVRNGRWLGCAVAIACAGLSVIACGGDGDSSSDSKTTEKSPTPAATESAEKPPAKPKRIPRCGPTGGSPTSLDGVRITKPGRQTKIPLSDLRRGPGTVRVSIVGTFDAGRRVKNTVTGKGTFKAKRARFVAVVFKVSNHGEKAVSAASVGAPFRLVAEDKAYPLTDALPKCGPISASVVASDDLPSSLGDRLSSPGTGVQPGDTAESMLVFTLPRGTSAETWFSPRLKRALDVGDAPELD